MSRDMTIAILIFGATGMFWPRLYLVVFTLLHLWVYQ